jgi:predicted homoserine dehydrogenase-like protein
MRLRIVTLAEWDKNENMLDLVPWISTMGSTWMAEGEVKQRPRTFPSTAPTSAVNEARRETNIR